jgi:hypothetical protein
MNLGFLDEEMHRFSLSYVTFVFVVSEHMIIAKPCILVLDNQLR